MLVGVCTFELHLPSGHGLKDKRRVIKGLIERLHERYRVSVAETDFHDLHQRSEISLAVVSNSEREIERLLEEIHRMVDSLGSEAYLSSWNPQILEAAP